MPKFQFAKSSKKGSEDKKTVEKILIVDDDPSIHEISNMAISSMEFADFKIETLNAMSAQEAKKILEEEENIALALIDVVMETPQAGLDLVNYIRNDLRNDMIRLIIRTGQANDNPEMQVIQQYDINDFKEKTELTINKLYTTIRTSIQQYKQLQQLQSKFEETYQQLTTDPLTKLPNRVKLVEDFSHNSEHTLIMIDIVGFSLINDTNGFEVGDFVLKELGGFLSSMYGENFNVYHLGNDLFALATKTKNMQNLVETVQKIKQDIAHLEIMTNNFHKTIETTIGVAHQTENDVIKKAELALKEARNTGKNKIKYYSDDLKIINRIGNTNHWAPIVKNALENDKIKAYAQPIYDTFDRSIEKYELLVRLENEGKIHPPADFLSAAADSGQLYNIFKFMFEQGCIFASKTNNKYSINISENECNYEELVPFIKATLEKHGVAPGLISLEILENNAISNSQESIAKINSIQELGIEIIIDDFGVQCSNFGQAMSLNVKTLKLDGSYIKNVDTSPQSRAIVKTIKTFAEEQDYKLVAEFVHNEAVFNIMKELGIHYVQGYYLAKPSPLS